MKALAYWKAVTMDDEDFLEKFLELLESLGVRFCVIGGQAVNAYVEPVVSLDLDVAVAVGDLADLKTRLEGHFELNEFPHRLNLSLLGSDLRIQIQTDHRYSAFVDRAQRREVLGVELPVATIDDVLQGKIWAVQDPDRRPSKRQKDLADIARLIEAHPELRKSVPRDVLARLIT